MAPTHHHKNCHWCSGEVQPIKCWDELMEWREPQGGCAGGKGGCVRKLKPRTSSSHPRTLVCHDMKGGYLDDRFVSGCDNKDAYRFYHWSGVDTFVYFSHHLVTIPPPGWINTAHTHGVTVLGTFITEWEAGRGVCEKLLASEDTVDEAVRQLTHIAHYHGFEGWLINIENELPKDKIPLMLKFVRDLTVAMREGLNNRDEEQDGGKDINKEHTDEEIKEEQSDKKTKNDEHSGERTKEVEELGGETTEDNYKTRRKEEETFEGTHRVIWYDSVTKEGKLDWQNELNGNNEDFFNACDGIFLNYTWSEAHLDRTRRAAGDRTRDVYVGLDVFGRNFYAGGKYDTWKALEIARKFGLSAAIFAPGWTYETQADFTKAETRLWESLAPFLTHRGFQELPFMTSFCQGFGERLYCRGKVEREGPWHNLNDQQPQPLWSQQENNEELAGATCVSLVTLDAYNGGGCLGITTRTPITFRLLLCSVEWREVLRLSVVYKWCSQPTSFSLLCHLVGKQSSSKNKILKFTCEKGTEGGKDGCEEKEDEEIIECTMEDSHIENGWSVRTFTAVEIPDYIMTNISLGLGGDAELRLGHLAITNITTTDV